jgi:transposase
MKKQLRKILTDTKAVGAVNTSNSAKHFLTYLCREAAKELNVSESTVRRLIKKDMLEGELFEQQRSTHSLPSPSKYHISQDSLRRILESKVRT